MSQVWDQCGDLDESFAVFRRWRDLGKNRPSLAVFSRQHPSPYLVLAWASDRLWEDRVARYVEHVAKTAAAAQLEDEADFDPAAAERAEVRRRVMLREWKKIDKRSESAEEVPIFNAGELARLEKAERDNGALHTTRARVGARRFLTGDGGAASQGGADMSKLTPDQQLQLLELLRLTGMA